MKKYVIQLELEADLLLVNKMMNAFLDALQKREKQIKNYSVMEVD